MEYTEKHTRSWPVEKNMESIPCKYDCGSETLVMQKHYVLTYTCPVCYNAETTSKKWERVP